MRGRSAIVLFPLLPALAAAPAAADALYALSSNGTLRAIDPGATSPITFATLALPGRVVTGGAGLAVGPGGVVYGLAYVADACSLDPSRTTYVSEEDYECGGLAEDACAQAYAVRNGEPYSCNWLGPGAGCEVHGLNTCAPPPPCEGAPERVHVVGGAAADCHAYDGDAAGCAASYFVDDQGASTCYDAAGQCVGCDVASAAAGLCTRGCDAPETCEDPAHTLYAGPYDGCWLIGPNDPACATAFTTYAGTVFACFEDGDGYCGPCTPDAQAYALCANTCEPAPACAGDPGRVQTDGCYTFDDDAAACADAWELTYTGAVSCAMVNGHCLPCGDGLERNGSCIEACTPPVCADDPARTTVVAGGADGCHAHDGDQAACEASFYVGSCGEASCYWSGATATCEPCTVDHPEACSNACGAFAPLPPGRHAPSLLTLDPAAAQATPLAVADDLVEQPVVLADGTILALSRYPECHQADSLFTIDAGDGRLSLLDALPAPSGGALAVRPADGHVYRLVRGDDGPRLFVIDPVSGQSEEHAVSGGEPWYQPTAMTWADACDAFVVAESCGSVLLLDPASGALTETAVYVPNECDEGDWPVGLVLDGATCPVLELPTTTSTSTSTTTTTSTSTSTLPSEPLAGSRLLLTDDAKHPRRRRLAVRARGSAITMGGGPESADDPVLHGGSLRVAASSGSFDFTYALADGWRYVGKPGRVRGYKRRAAGPLRSIVLRAGRSLEIRGKGEALAQPLLVDPGRVRVVLRLGERQWCLEFGGTFPRRTPKKVLARDAPAPVACPLPSE